MGQRAFVESVLEAFNLARELGYETPCFLATEEGCYRITVWPNGDYRNDDEEIS
jgi:hypothetical protein